MIDRVTGQGDATRGESIYRREGLQCIVCHAIGESGGRIGPNLVSIGASAPVDYLIESPLEPSKKIKEGYHTNLVTLKNGDSHAGGIVSESAQQLVIRDLTGNHKQIARADIAEQIIAPVSIMPVGLTTQFREAEFVDLVRFMSELGKDGKFMTPPNRFIRHWQILPAHSPNPGTIGHYGLKALTEDSEALQWKTLYAEVGGGLPLGEMPVALGGMGGLRVARAYVEVPKAGVYRLRMSGALHGFELFLNDQPVPVHGHQPSFEVSLKCLKAGRQAEDHPHRPRQRQPGGGLFRDPVG